MNDDEKLDRILESIGEIKITMTEMKKDYEAAAAKNDDRFGRVETDLKDGAESRKRIHERIDGVDERLKKVEANPVFTEWAAIKGKALGTVWVALGIIAVAVILNALPNIQRLMGG